MRRRSSLAVWTVLVIMIVGARASGQDYPPVIPDAAVRTFKTIGSVKLDAWIFRPASGSASDSRPAIVFFFGGGWTQGTPAQFARQARALSERGMVAILADYRVAGRHGTRPGAAVEDAKSAVRWVRAHAREFGIDPNRIAAGGGSAGGHLAAASATLRGFDDPAEGTAVSSVPNALALFNPVVVVAPVEGLWEMPPNLRERFGTDDWIALSPFHHVGRGHPPTLIQHGVADALVPIATVRSYCARVIEQGGRCELAEYEGAGHGFFNNDPHYQPTLNRMIQFFTSIGWIRADGR